MKLALLLATFTAVSSANTLYAETLIVGPGGGFTEIQRAIDVAMPGDVLLVRPGIYEGFILDKPLQILGAGQDEVIVSNTRSFSTCTGFCAPQIVTVTIENIPANSEVLLSGMTIRGFGATAVLFFGFADYSAGVRNSQGRVLLHDLKIDANVDSFSLRGMLVVENSDFVELQDSFVTGFESPTNFYQPLTDAVRVTDSTIWIINSRLHGGADSSPGSNFSPGGIALQLSNSEAYLANSELIGGTGGTVEFPPVGGSCGGGSPNRPGIGLIASGSVIKLVGGPEALISSPNSSFSSVGFCGFNAKSGVELNSGSILLLRDDTVINGGGTFKDGVLLAQEPPVDVSAGSVSYVTSNDYPILELRSRAVAPGGSQVFVASGEALATGRLYAGLERAEPFGIAGIDGASALDPSTTFFLRGFRLDAVGAKSFTLSIPNDPSLESLPVHFQWIQANGQKAWFSNPSTMIIRG